MPHVVSKRLWVAAALLTLIVSTEAVDADTVSLQDRLLCPAELVVLRADAKRLASAAITDAERRGLINRITAALATLPWLCRRYLEIRANSGSDDSSTHTLVSTEQFVDAIRALRELSSEPNRLVAALKDLIDSAPLPIARFLLDAAGDADEQEMGEVYMNYCHGCHSTTNSESENPAYPLDQMARDRPQAEFFARMLLGVRGTADIGLSNPLTPKEIGAMQRYLLKFDP